MTPADDLLIGLEPIARYIGRRPATIRDILDRYGLPGVKTMHDGTPIATKADLDVFLGRGRCHRCRHYAPTGRCIASGMPGVETQPDDWCGEFVQAAPVT